MKPPKVQRWIDLLAALLRRQYPVTFDQLIGEVPGYAAEQKPESLRRTFERDKLELRKFGVPIETVENYDGEVPGYQLRVRDFYLPYLALRSEASGTTLRKPHVIDRYGYRSLPTLTFEPDELAAVADAAGRVRQLGDPLLAEHAESAMRKRLRYSPRIARWIAEREGKPLADDGSLTLEHPLADLDWAVRHILQYGPEVTVLEPDEVRQAVVRRLERMSAS